MPKSKLSYCGEQVRLHDNDRFLCSLFAPPAEREALWALYAFNVEVARIREQVREPLLGHIRLRWWTEAIDAVYAGSPPRHEVATALAAAVEAFRPERAHFDRIIEARARDLDDMAPPSLTSLVEYADATSGALSAAARQILGADGAATAEATRDVAIAWALAGLMRAVPFHARTRRSYLPTDIARAAGLDSARLFDRGSVPGLREVVAEVASVAGDHLRRARERRQTVDRAALPVLLPAVLCDLYLARLRRADHDPFDAAVGGPVPWRMLRLAAARARGRF